MIESIAITNFYCFNETTKISFVAGRERNRLLDEMYSGFTEQKVTRGQVPRHRSLVTSVKVR